MVPPMHLVAMATTNMATAMVAMAMAMAMVQRNKIKYRIVYSILRISPLTQYE